LRLAENHFLEVLLSKFDLYREGKRAHLEVSFDSETPACWNRSGREELRDFLFQSREKVDRYQETLDDVLVRECRDEFVLDDPDFVFRWASAGALPIIRLGSEEYYCLFYREIFPIGWNIANGACDSSAELLDPLHTLERELCEELILLDPRTSDWCVLERGDQGSMDRPEFSAVRLIVEDLKSKGIWDKGVGVSQLETALKWFNGPDVATIYVEDRCHEVAGCYLNINAEDFGIELDRVVKINVSEDTLVYDGEIQNGKLLNRPVGLFRTDRPNPDLDQVKFVPDKCFYGGVEFDGPAFERLMGDRFIRDIKAAGLRSAEAIQKYEKQEHKFNLCPVTRRLLQRYARTVPKQQAVTEPFEVFVSFGHGDEKLADQVAQFITKRCGKRVFYYPRTQTDHDFSRAIDSALESAQCIVAVGSRLEHLTGRWPEYEYRTFNVDVHSGKKPNGKMLSLVLGIDPVDLPLPLRRFVVTSCPNESDLPKALEQLLPYVTGDPARKC
jgi:hypothetical protein